MSTVDINGLNKEFHGLPVVRDLNLRIERGEFVSILGPSGCGKSTVLNMIAGFIPPSQGSIKVAGHEVTGPGPDRGVCFQQSALFPWLSLWENITFGPKAQGVFDADRKARARQLLHEFGLGEFHGHRPSQLSGGMQQRAAIARILINNPDILLMDEPFGALDAQTRLRMQNFLMKVQREFGCTILFITHDVDEAIYISDRVLVMSARPGHIVEELVVSQSKPRTTEFLLSEEFRDHKYRAFKSLEASFNRDAA